MADPSSVVEVSRRIDAPAPVIFDILASPRRHADFDGSGMLRGAAEDRRIAGAGETFTIRMHRLGRDYQMINHVVEFEADRRIAWEPAPGDIETAGGDASRIGVPSGYRWGYRLDPDGDAATVVTEVFDCGSDANRWILERDGGEWINGHHPVAQSMRETLAKLDEAATGSTA